MSEQLKLFDLKDVFYEKENTLILEKDLIGINRKCKKCLEIKDLSLFAKQFSNAPSSISGYKYKHMCSSCNNIRSFNRRRTMHGRIMNILESAKRRTKEKGFTEFNLDYDFVYSLISYGKCIVTNIHFILENKNNSFTNPYAPSLDRIDSSKGYTKDNVRAVIWQYNTMKGELTDEQVLEICKAVIKHSKKKR